ncbi:SDR family oxidoreductase [Pantoea stewartii]|nr:SDR family oxidoreductase [Pantoea stewartii]
MNIKGAVIMITGASSGIGAATARAAAQSGAQVVLIARRKERISALAQTLGNAIAITCDVTRHDEIANAVQTTLSHFGRVDALINNAGQGLHGAIETIGSEDFMALLDVNLVAPLRMMQAVLPAMRQQGRGSIVNVSSGATLATYPGSAAYTSAKAGLNMLSRVARLELASEGITVSTFYPFVTATEFYQSVKSGREQASAQEKEIAAFAHSPEKVAESLLMLLESGDAEQDLVPEAYGGSVRDA